MNGLQKYILAYGAYVAFLHAVPGPWRRWKEGREGKVFDWWSVQHVLWGALAERWGLSRVQLLALGLANEGVEYAVRKARPDLLWASPESPRNVGADLLAAALGHALAQGLS